MVRWIYSLCNGLLLVKSSSANYGRGVIMKTNKSQTLSMLKLASKFCDKKDMRTFVRYVQVIKDIENDSILFYASNGHIAIKIKSKQLHLPIHEKLPSQLTIDSINTAHKVNLPELLQSGNDDFRFPNFERIFNKIEQQELESTEFDAKYLSLVFTSLEVFKKEIGIKLARVKLKPLYSKECNIMTCVFNENLSSEIKIEIALMPLNP